MIKNPNCLETGADDFLQKPYAFSDSTQQISALLET